MFQRQRQLHTDKLKLSGVFVKPELTGPVFRPVEDCSYNEKPEYLGSWVAEVPMRLPRRSCVCVCYRCCLLSTAARVNCASGDCGSPHRRGRARVPQVGDRTGQPSQRQGCCEDALRRHAVQRRR
jgi:hypothetical protein